MHWTETMYDYIIWWKLSLCVCAVGEPINTEAWEWYHRVVGDGRCPVVDTWWQTGNWDYTEDWDSLAIATILGLTSSSLLILRGVIALGL